MNKDEIIEKRKEVLSRLVPSGVDSYGFCECPGIRTHTSKNNLRDFQIFGIDGKSPRGMCFHSNCREAVEAFNERLATELVLANAHYWPWDEASMGTGIKRRRRVPADLDAIQNVVSVSAIPRPGRQGSDIQERGIPGRNGLEPRVRPFVGSSLPQQR